MIGVKLMSEREELLLLLMEHPEFIDRVLFSERIPDNLKLPDL